MKYSISILIYLHMQLAMKWEILLLKHRLQPVSELIQFKQPSLKESVKKSLAPVM